MADFSIGSRRIGPGEPAFVIAEVGINHCGDRNRAIEMCRLAKRAGADAVKFQTFRAVDFCGDPTQTYTYRSRGETVTESMLDMFRRHELFEPDWRAIRAACDEIGITFFSTPQDPNDLELLLEIGVPALKIGSDDFSNLPLVAAYARTGLPLILSCGMADLADIHAALEASGWFSGAPVALLLCTSLYPTPPEEVRISRLTTLRQTFPGLIVGFSDHTRGPLAAGLATALGASIFEKHFTLSQDLPGPDHWFSEDPDGLASWISAIRDAERMIGAPYLRPSPAELEMRTLARRSVVALVDIAVGETLGPSNIGARRPGDGLPPSALAEIEGLRATRSIAAGERLAWGDFGR